MVNVLITGTPGSGKTTLAESLSSNSHLQHIEIGKLVKAKGFTSGYDKKFECDILDEDALLDELEPILAAGNVVVDYHGCDFFPERFFDLVVVLTVDNSILYSRLESRGYSQFKIQQNVQCEIMRVIQSEAEDSYCQDIIMELPSNSLDDLEDNVSKILSKLQPRV